MIPKTYQDLNMPEVEALLAANNATVLVDVREPWEFEEFNIGGLNIPLADIRQRRSELLAYQNMVVVCTNGTRSKVAAKDYCRAEEFAQTAIFHLKGGILEIEEF